MGIISIPASGTKISTRWVQPVSRCADKFGIILRIETSTNVSEFQHFREVSTATVILLKKLLLWKRTFIVSFSVGRVIESNKRFVYLEFTSKLWWPYKQNQNLNKVTQDIEKANRNYKGFNFFSNEDLNLLFVLTKGELNINGIRNQYIRQHLLELR